MNKKNNRPLPEFQPESHIQASVITEIPADLNPDTFTFDPNLMPLFPLSEHVVFPHSPVPVPVENEEYIPFLEFIFEKRECIFCAIERPGESKGTRAKDYFPVGIICKVAKIIKVAEMSTVVFLIPGPRAKIGRVVRKDFPLYVTVKPVGPVPSWHESMGRIMILDEISKYYDNLLDFLPEQQRENLVVDPAVLKKDPINSIYYMAANSPIDIEAKAAILAADNQDKLLEKTLSALDNAYQKMQLRASIHMRTHQELTEQQKRSFLEQQIKSIRSELNSSEGLPDEEELREKASHMTWSEEAARHFEKEVRKLERLNTNSPDYSTQYDYLQTLLELPWDKYSPDNVDLAKVEEVLNRDHYGLEQVKDRILEQMAVIKLRNDLKAPIICLYGPPGVGKTSLGKSVAEALGREYARVSLGGLHDEAEIRGHRRTYVGAMPGRIIEALKKSGTGNPVFVLDEIDKIGRDYKGDPSTALLEVLDPEQNNKFHDNFVDFDYDLSKILFIATANNISEISRPLLDRMELIEISGYIPDEKVEIAKRHLVPKALEDTGYEPGEIAFDDNALRLVIDRYTRESGVRQLEKKIAKVLRKTARLKASGKDFPKVITPEIARELLGKEEVNPDVYSDNSFAGVVTGLAWTQVGGEILFIETSLSPGKGDKLALTGKLGDVMKESAAIALQYLKAHAKQAGIDPEMFSKADIHIHVPEGAVPKDGPSAGITMATSIASALTGRKVRPRVAMTGEITLRGKVLPVGGVKEKILAAKRAGITDIILSRENERDILEIQKRYLEGLSFHYVDTVLEVLEFALLPDLAEHRYEF